MASVLYNSLTEDISNGNVIFGTHSFYVMLLGSSYTPDKDLHTRRSDVTNEITSPGYTTGGSPVAVTVVKYNQTDETTVTFGQVTFATLTAQVAKCAYYRRRGGAASLDELVACVEYPATQNLIGQPFTTGATIIRLKNQS